MVEHATLDLVVVSLSPMLGVEITLKSLKKLFRGAWLAHLEEHKTLDLEVVSLSSMLGVAIT